MALPANIQQFKSSGVYRLEFDKSQLINIPAETIRLVIGYSNKGPFNTPIFVPDAVFFKDVFGDIDNGLELKGSYFHRSCLTALDRGPILALNLMKLDSSVTAEFRPMSAQSNAHNLSENYSPVSEFFNQDKFWFIDDDAVINAINSYTGTVSQAFNKDGSTILNYANAGKKTFSVFTVKSDVTGFDTTAEEWYGSGKVPPFLDKSSFVSDFLVRVLVIDGDFSDYQALSIDPIYGAYFDATGLKSTYTDSFGNVSNGLNAFIAIPEVNVLAEYTGSLLPEFQDKDGTNLFIEDIINNETSKTGLVCAMNNDWFYDNPSAISDAIVDGLQIDLIGHGIEENDGPGGAISTLDFLSYYGSLNKFKAYQEKRFNQGATAGATSDYLFAGTAGGATPFYTLDATPALTTAGFTGAYDIIKLYGPNHPDVLGGTYQSLFTSTSEWTTWAGSVVAGKSFVTCGVTGAATGAIPAGTTYTAARVKSSTLKTSTNLDDLLEISIENGSEAGDIAIVAGTTTGQGTVFSAGYPAGAKSATGITPGAATVEVLASLNYVDNPGTTHDIMYGGPGSNLYADANSGIITTGDKIQGVTAGSLALGTINSTIITTNDLSTTGLGAGVQLSLPGAGATSTEILLSHQVGNAKITSFTDDTFATTQGILPGDDGFVDQFIAIPQNGATGATYTESVYISTLAGDINEVFPCTPAEVFAANEVHLNAGATLVGDILVGQFLVRGFEQVVGSGDYNSKIDPRTGTTRLTRITSASYDGATGSATFGKFIIKTQDAIYTYPDQSGTPSATAIERYKSIDDFVTHYKSTALTGYTIPASAKPDGSNTRMNEILDVMYDTNIAETLSDREAITFRYIVDTFNNGIEPSSKSRFSKIAKGRMNAFAILNSPSVKEFKNSVDPMFKFSSTSTFDPRYIATGGNLSLNPNNIYSLPSIADGANYCGFYTPNLKIIEKGATKFIPPAAHVSNLFIDKYNLALPWSIVAGPRRGVVSGTGVAGVEYEFDRKALDEIEPFGLNAIINKRGFGLVINANQTAQQTVKSALSQIHVRELLIYIEDGIAEILKNYRWEFNTAQNRLEIKTLADNFLAQILNDGGLFDYQNIMDSTNNTPEVIDNNIGIIDTYVEPVRGMGILVNRVTILSTGAIQAGNF